MGWCGKIFNQQIFFIGTFCTRSGLTAGRGGPPGPGGPFIDGGPPGPPPPADGGIPPGPPGGPPPRPCGMGGPFGGPPGPE